MLGRCADVGGAGQGACLADGERLAAVWVVDGEVEARAEEVLVRLRVDTWRHQGPVFGVGGVLVWGERVGGQLARQLDLVLDGAVLRGENPLC